MKLITEPRIQIFVHDKRSISRKCAIHFAPGVWHPYRKSHTRLQVLFGINGQKHSLKEIEPFMWIFVYHALNKTSKAKRQ